MQNPCSRLERFSLKITQKFSYLLPDANGVVLVGKVVVVVADAVVEALHVAGEPGVVLGTAGGWGPGLSTGDLVHPDLPHPVK